MRRLPLRPPASLMPALAAIPRRTAERPIRVMLVDDHASFRASARWLLETEGFEIVAEAASGESALDLVAAADPELVLLDVGLPGIDGFQVATSIRARFPRARIVLISSRELRDLGADRVLACGAVGFVHKADLSRATLTAAVS
jgi:DNA-binding NarL/FixJ family response regulator